MTNKVRTRPLKLFALPLATSLLVLSACDKETTPPPTPEVTVSKAISQEITPYLVESGNTVASTSIDLVARVSGYLESNNFKDGSAVKKDDLLFVIQPTPYANNVIMAQATLTGNHATYEYDQSEYQRQTNMYKRQATSLADVQQWKSTRDTSAANVENAAANLENEQINYSYTHIVAPINGRIGRHLVDPGNLVGNGEATTLATIEQLDPMYVYFNINELDLLKLRRMAHKAGFKPGQINTIPLQIKLQDETEFSDGGFLDFASTEVDTSTGTIQMRGVLSNPDWKLLPGFFVKVRFPIGKTKEELTLPETAVMHDQIGAYVYTVDNHNKVEEMRVKTGSTEQGRIAILEGLSEKDRVVIDGLQNASPGITVKTAEKTTA